MNIESLPFETHVVHIHETNLYYTMYLPITFQNTCIDKVVKTYLPKDVANSHACHRECLHLCHLGL